jgi:hypothetical protein
MNRFSFLFGIALISPALVFWGVFLVSTIRVMYTSTLPGNCIGGVSLPTCVFWGRIELVPSLKALGFLGASLFFYLLAIKSVLIK